MTNLIRLGMQILHAPKRTDLLALRIVDEAAEMERPDATADRAMRIAEIKRQIARGEYETPEKVEQAVEAFLDSSEAHAGNADFGCENHVPRKRPK